MSAAPSRRVLVTGARGQLGRALQHSAPADVEVVALDRSQLDIGDRAAVRDTVARVMPGLIINAAAYTAVDKAEVERELAFRINGDAPGHFAESAAQHGARLIHVSTDYVFDGTACSPYAPGAPTNPVNAYGASKLAGERAVLERAGDRALIVRTAWVYAQAGTNFVNTMLRLMRERDEVRVIADQVGTPTHAASLARALWQLSARQASGVHHWTDAGVASWYDFAVAIENLQREQRGKTVKVTPIATKDYPLPARRPAYGVLDKSSAFALIGPARHWREELAAMLLPAT